MRNLFTILAIFIGLALATAQSVTNATKTIDKALKKVIGSEFLDASSIMKEASYQNDILEYKKISNLFEKNEILTQTYEDIKWKDAIRISSGDVHKTKNSDNKSVMWIRIIFPPGIVKGAMHDDEEDGGDGNDYISLYIYEEDKQKVMEALEILKNN